MAVSGTANAQNPIVQKPEPRLALMSASNDVSSQYPLLIQPLHHSESPDKSISNMLSLSPNLRFSSKNTTEMTAETLNFVGNLIYAKTWASSSSSSPYGIYSFTASAGSAKYDALATNIQLNANGGGVMANGIYHFVRYTSYGGEYYVYYYEYDVNSKKFIKSGKRVQGMSLISASGLAYDKTTGRAFGQFLSADGSSLELGSLDFDSESRSTITVGGSRLYAIAMNDTGTLYGIDESGILYKIDKTTGQRNKIGKTGITPKGMQSAAFNPKDGNLYWASIDQKESSVIYKVNTTDATLEKVADMPDGEEIVGMSFLSSTNDDAPASVEEVAATPDVSNPNNIKVSFNLPSKTFKGDVLKDNVNYIIYVNGIEAINGQGKAGDVVSKTVTAATGDAVISVVVKNDSGESPFTIAKVYAGPDAPLAPSNVKLTADNSTGKVNLIWNRPAPIGANKGSVDTTNLNYSVVRYPDSVLVATTTDTTFTETITPNELTLYYYTVTAINKGIKSKIGKSNSVSLGSYKKTPYFENFNNEDALSLFTIVNNNNDTYTWQFMNNRAGLHYNWRMDADDWLITPAIKLNAGRRYTFSLKAYGSARYIEKLEVKYGNGTDPTAFTSLIDTTEVNTSDGMTVSHTLEVPSDGTYHFGIHGISPKTNTYILYVDDIAVDEGVSLSAPDSVNNISITPLEPGSQRATISFTVPSTDLNGKTLSSVDSVAIYRQDGKKIGTVKTPKVGTIAGITDEDATNGFNTYTIIPYNASGKGVENSARAFLGYDTPMNVTNVKMVDNGDNSVTITWDAVGNKGVNGGYVDPAKVKYDVYSSDGEYLTGIIASVTGKTSIIISGLDLDSEKTQDALIYGVVASTTHGSSNGVPVSILQGKPLNLPFNESFESGDVHYDEWFLSSSNNNNFALYSIPEDNDGGSIRWLPTIDGENATLSTGKLCLKGTVNPKLTFWYYSAPGRKMKLNVEVNKAQKDGIDTVLSINYDNLNGEEGWRQAIVDLSEYKELDYIIVRFHGITGEARLPLVLDNIRITDVKSHDLEASMVAPESSHVGIPSAVKVTVTNFGENEASDYGVIITANGDKIGEIKDDASKISPYGGYKTYTFNYTAKATDVDKTELKAEIIYSADELADNNVATGTTVVIPNDVPTASDLNAANSEDGVELSWTAPAIKEHGDPVTDSFENYSDNVIGSFGDWVTIDGDQQNTYALDLSDSGIETGIKMSYFVFNPTDAYFGFMSGLKANSGNQYLASFAAENNNDDDWLVSPALDGSAQTISFYAKDYESYYGLDKFEILYSTTNTDTASFVRVPGTEEMEATTTWTEITAKLPAGARYFAIHKKSSGFVFMLDDFTYISGKNGAGLKITGYNVYCDGVLVANVPSNNTTYTDTAVKDGNHVYMVTALYGNVESAPISSSVNVTTGIDNISSGYIVDDNASVYTISGTYVGKVSQLNTLPSGTYIIFNGKRSIKLVK